jgi:hypothetical protein
MLIALMPSFLILGAIVLSVILLSILMLTGLVLRLISVCQASLYFSMTDCHNAEFHYS